MKVENVGVIGAGQMGAGIAQVCASIGKKVILCDIKKAHCVKKGARFWSPPLSSTYFIYQNFHG